jgi:hypothetical protein
MTNMGTPEADREMSFELGEKSITAVGYLGYAIDRMALISDTYASSKVSANSHMDFSYAWVEKDCQSELPRFKTCHFSVNMGYFAWFVKTTCHYIRDVILEVPCVRVVL